MEIGENVFLGRLKDSDNSINLDHITLLSKPLSKTIEGIIRLCDILFKKRYSLFLTGSSAMCLRAGSFREFRMKNDKSDVDFWIVADTLPQVTISPSIAEKEIIKGFYRLNHFDISCVPFFDNKFNVSLKIMHSKVVKKVFQLNKLNLKVFRNSSLKVIKSEDKFFGLRSEYHISICERKLKDIGYLWRWKVDPFMRKDFVLTDLHSCFLIGGFLIDTIGLGKGREKFLKKFSLCFDKFNKAKLVSCYFQLLQYFYIRFPSSATKIFGHRKRASSFIENAR